MGRDVTEVSCTAQRNRNVPSAEAPRTVFAVARSTDSSASFFHATASVAVRSVVAGKGDCRPVLRGYALRRSWGAETSLCSCLCRLVNNANVEKAFHGSPEFSRNPGAAF